MKKVGVLFATAVLALAMLPATANAVSGSAPSGTPVTGAAFTTVNEAVDGTGHCKNGNPGVNCNIYDGKEFVWLNGGPAANGLGPDGSYFFVVLAPGGQPTPNDGGAKNLSDDFDAYTNRTFTVANGEVSAYSGTQHDKDIPFIRLAPYADTPNPGGVYIMAVCSLADGYPVAANDCKYDAFKVEEEQIPPASDLAIVKSVNTSLDRTYTWTIKKDADKTRVQQSGTDATFTYTITVTHDGGTDSNIKVTGTITVVNPNSFAVPVTITDATDQVPCVVNDPTTTIAANSPFSTDYTCTYTSTPASLSGTNTATVTWSDVENLKGNSADFSVPFTFEPNLIDNCAAVTDPAGGGLLGTPCVGGANPATFTYSRTVSGVVGKCTSFDNTATFTTNTTGTKGSDTKTVTVCVGADLTVSKTAATAFTRTFTWGISKAVDKTQINITPSGTATFNYTVNVTHDTGTDSAWVLSGKITVNNPNDWEAITANVTDAIPSCSVTNGANVSVPAGGSVILDYTCNMPSGAGGTNTATATWDKDTFTTPTGSASGSASFAFVTPTMIVNGTVSVSDPLDSSAPRTFSYADPSPSSFTYSHSFTGDPAGTCTRHDNTATFTTNTTGTTGSDSKEVTVCVGKDLTVAKTATPAFKRTYKWAITKDVDKTLVEQIGGTATFNYTINANETGFVDSDWMVTGTITITNPNDWEAITANVADAIDNGGSCSITGSGLGMSVPASGSVPLTYTCIYTAATSTPPDGTNTATATWDKTAFFTPTGSAFGTAAVSFNTAPTSTVNKTITVTDTFNSVTIPLGTLTATDATPFTSATYHDSRTVNVPASNCIKYTNTAVIVETGQLAQRTVEVCGPAASGALTMGFWQNKNGQGIINSANQVSLSAFLKGYHPFSDLSSPITTYVTNVIKAANASGSSMNAMLKAQMLATALDVYFSDPANGNPIKAPAPIGGITIDLTKICQMIDGSGGTATCSGTFENVSSAFGGATSMTVSNMLLYQNTSDPAVDAGASWYGQVKATQQLAKDAFDAINNQVAFAP